MQITYTVINEETCETNFFTDKYSAFRYALDIQGIISYTKDGVYNSSDFSTL